MIGKIKDFLGDDEVYIRFLLTYLVFLILMSTLIFYFSKGLTKIIGNTEVYETFDYCINYDEHYYCWND